MAGVGARKRRRMRMLGRWQDDLCFYCDQPLIYLDPDQKFESDEGNAPDVASEDHFIPRAKGGHNSSHYNRVIAHRACNSKKGDNLPDETLIAKLEALNQKRGFKEPPKAGGVAIDSFGKPFPGLVYLIDLLNSESGGRGVRLRNIVTNHMNEILKHVRLTENVPGREYRGYLLRLVYEDFFNKIKPLGDPYDSLLRNFAHVQRRRVLDPDRDESQWEEYIRESELTNG